MATEMRARLERRILDLAARLSADDNAAEETNTWQRAELSRRFSRHVSSMQSSTHISSLPLAMPPRRITSLGRGRNTVLRNRLGHHSARDSIVTDPDRIHGLALLDVGVVASDGGEYSTEYKLANLLEQNSSTYCSAKSKNIVVVFEHASTLSFVMTHAVMRSPPAGSFTAPVKDALVFVSNSPIGVSEFTAYDDYTADDYESLLARKKAGGESLDEGEPAAFLSAVTAEVDGTITTKLSVPRTGRFIAVKFLRSVNSDHSSNIVRCSSFPCLSIHTHSHIHSLFPFFLITIVVVCVCVCSRQMHTLPPVQDCEFIGFKGFSGTRGFADGTMR
eukprot:m.45443 g.45443  ORF g.45443 m.45443 type:complete len:333 (-) comp15208_c0_seq1:1058-2056(-)